MENVKILFAFLINYLNHDENKLKQFGYQVGRNMLILNRFDKDNDIEGLLYKITFSYLPLFYNTTRYLEKRIGGNSTKSHYLIIEPNSLFNNICLNKLDETFCYETIFAGVIEMILAASEVSAEVNAHNILHEQYNEVIYEIKLF